MNKKILLPLLLLLTVLSLALLPRMSEAQIGFLIQETDGSPAYKNPRGLIFPNGSLSDTRGVITVASVFAGNLTLASADVLSNATDDVLSFESEDEISTLQAKGFEAKAAGLRLLADQDDDATDGWELQATTAGALNFGNDSSVAGTFVTKLGLSSAGVLTLSDSETLTNLADVVTLAADDAAASFVVKGFEASSAAITLQADESDDAGDDWIMTAATNGTLTLRNDVSSLDNFRFYFDGDKSVLRVGPPSTADANLEIIGAEGFQDVTIHLYADEGDDDLDKWQIVADNTVFMISNVSIGRTLNLTPSLALYGNVQNQVTSTSTTLAVSQCGSTIINDSADVLTLPQASTALGCRYTFVVNNASNLDINPNDATDIILPFINAIATDPTLISPSAGDAIRCATVGGSITLEAVSADNWVVVGGVAGHSWSDIN